MPNYKLYDFQCPNCDITQELMIDVPRGQHAPDFVTEICQGCGHELLLERMLPLVAEYLGEKVRNTFNPRVCGGRHDTEGWEREPTLPDIPGEREIEARQSAIIEGVMAGGGDLNDAQRAVEDAGATISPEAATEHFHTKEWREAKAELKAVRKRNKVKRLRSKMLDKGETTLRETPVAGDSAVFKQGAS